MSHGILSPGSPRKKYSWVDLQRIWLVTIETKVTRTTPFSVFFFFTDCLWFFILFQAKVMVEVSDREHSRQLKSLLDHNFHVTFCSSAVNIKEWWVIGRSVEPSDCFRTAGTTGSCLFVTGGNIAKKREKEKKETQNTGHNRHKDSTVIYIVVWYVGKRNLYRTLKIGKTCHSSKMLFVERKIKVRFAHIVHKIGHLSFLICSSKWGIRFNSYKNLIINLILMKETWICKPNNSQSTEVGRVL